VPEAMAMKGASPCLMSRRERIRLIRQISTVYRFESRIENQYSREIKLCYSRFSWRGNSCRL